MAEPKRKVLQRIKINNGELTFEIDEEGRGNWYRNNQIINKDYKFFDKKYNKYRILSKEYTDNGVVPHTPIKLDNFDKLENIYFTKHIEKLLSTEGRNYPVGDKFINLKTKGRMNLATVPINMLDSIAINSGRSNTDIKTNLGLVGKESTFGGHSNALKNPWKEDTYNANFILNNHAYFTFPEEDYFMAAREKLKKDFYNDKLRIELENDIDRRFKNGFKSNTKHFSDNVMEDAFLRYTDNPARYNYGQKSYVPMVNNIANEVWNESQIQQWWNTEGKQYYEKGKQERKKHRSLED